MTDGYGGPRAPSLVRDLFPASPSILAHPDDLVRRKAELRARLLARRSELEAAEAAAAADAVAARVAELIPAEQDPAEQAVVAAYWPLAGELDPRPAMRRLAARGHRLALPRMQGKGLPLAFHVFDGDLAVDADQLLTRGGFGVMQPGPAVALAAPGVLLVPLLGFDRRGHRLGYGQGYYDRTLRALRAAGSIKLAIGLAFALQEVETVPAGPADEPLDAVVTERWSHRWAQAVRP